jgi:hypothetical protein
MAQDHDHVIDPVLTPQGFAASFMGESDGLVIIGITGIITPAVLRAQGCDGKDGPW